MNKKTESPKKRGKLATILIGLGGLLVVCCGLSAVGAVISPKAIPTPVATTAAITVKLAEGVTVMPSATVVTAASPAPTSTPAPTATPSAQMLVDAYKSSIGRIAMRTGEVLGEFSRLAGQVKESPEILSDTDWKLKMATALAGMKLQADEFRGLTAPAGFEEIDALVEQMADKLDSASNNFAAGIEAVDADKMQRGTDDLNAANALTAEITKRLTGGVAEPVSEAPTMSKRIQAAAGNPSVNIRAEASTDAAIAGQLVAGEPGEQIGANADGTWVQVRAGGVTGWIRADLVEAFTGAVAVVATEVPATSAPAVIDTPAPVVVDAPTSAPAVVSSGGGSFPAVGSACPPEAPIKGNINSEGEKIYHSPGQQAYERTIPEACYATGADAEQDGFRAAQR